MEQFETIIKLALKEDLKTLSLNKSPDCPSESELAEYLGGHLLRKKRNDIESHLSSCMACMEDLILARKAANLDTKKGPAAKNKNFKNWLKKNSWLFLALISFFLSFIYSRYFIQFLVATLVLSGKWIFETVNARILIMIYDAWKRGGEKEVSKILERFEDRTRIK